MVTTPSSAAASARSTNTQPYEPNRMLGWLYRRFFRHINVDATWRERVSRASQEGTVVYVMRSISFLDFLCLDYLVKQFSLPLVRFVNDLGLSIWEPFGKGGRRLRFRRQVPEDEAITRSVVNGHSALLFLRRPPRLWRNKRRGEALDIDLIEVLVRLQRRLREPILLVPQTIVWSKLPARRKPTVLDLFFGPVDWPGRVRVFFQFLLNYRNAKLRAGEPFDLAAFMQERAQLDDGQLAIKVRNALLTRMERERMLVLGPTRKTPTRLREEILRGPRVRKHIESEARLSKRKIERVEREARRELEKLCAAQNPSVLGILARVLRWCWDRIYRGIEVDEAGIERLREAARKGALILLPSHKSHVDYLVLSYIMYERMLSPPLIAAGDNLNFWPVGGILRRAGAFFIRRTFRGRKLYPALVDAYLRKVLVEGYTVEFFIEGGRSRTGKLLTPKLGLLSMIVDGALLLRDKPLYFAPISIGYERIVEQKTYAQELSGAEKAKENLSGLLKTSSILRSRYGRLYVQVGDIMSFDDLRGEIVAQHAVAPGDTSPTPPPLSAKERRLLVQRIAYRTVYEINRCTMVTPASLVALVLLACHESDMKMRALVANCERLVTLLDHRGARIASILDPHKPEQLREAVRETIRLFADSKLIVLDDKYEPSACSVIPEKRLLLEYYKNNILHFFVPQAILTLAILLESAQDRTQWVATPRLRHRVQRLSRVFKYEFAYRADASYEEIFEETLAFMHAEGELERFDACVRLVQQSASAAYPDATSSDAMASGTPGRDDASGCANQHIVSLYAVLLLPYFEAYRVVHASLAGLRDEKLTQKEWLRRTFALGRDMHAEGKVRYQESLSREKYQSILMALKDIGVVRFGTGDVIEIARDPDAQSGLISIEKDLLDAASSSDPHVPAEAAESQPGNGTQSTKC